MPPGQSWSRPPPCSDGGSLLDDFEWQDRRNPGPFGMDVDRLRGELGIADERG